MNKERFKKFILGMGLCLVAAIGITSLINLSIAAEPKLTVQAEGCVYVPLHDSCEIVVTAIPDYKGGD